MISRKSLKRIPCENSINYNRKRVFCENILPKDQHSIQGGSTPVRNPHTIENISLMPSTQVIKVKKIPTASGIIKAVQTQRNFNTKLTQQKQGTLPYQQRNAEIVTLKKRIAIKRTVEKTNISNDQRKNLAMVKKTFVSTKINKQQKEFKDIFTHEEAQRQNKQHKGGLELRTSLTNIPSIKLNEKEVDGVYTVNLSDSEIQQQSISKEFSLLVEPQSEIGQLITVNSDKPSDVLSPPIGAILSTSKVEKCYPITLTLTKANVTTTTTTPIKKCLVEEQSMFVVSGIEENLRVSDCTNVHTLVPSTSLPQMLPLSNSSITGQVVPASMNQELLRTSNKLRTINCNNFLSPSQNKITVASTIVRKLTNFETIHKNSSMTTLTRGKSTFNINANDRFAASGVSAANAALHDVPCYVTDVVNIKQMHDQLPLLTSSKSLYVNSMIGRQANGRSTTKMLFKNIHSTDELVDTSTSICSSEVANKVMPVMLTTTQKVQKHNIFRNGVTEAGNISIDSISKLSKPSITITASKISEIIKSNYSTSDKVSSLPNSVIISTGSSGSTLFRKSHNPQKTVLSTSSITATSTPVPQKLVSCVSNDSNKPQIISNIKLPPFTVTPTTCCTHSLTFDGLNISPKTVVTSNMKLCHSSNGKVFLQQTNVMDNSKLKPAPNLNSTKNSSIIIGENKSARSGSNLPSVQRYSLQKVHFIPSTPCTTHLVSQDSVGAILKTYGISGNVISKSCTATANQSPASAVLNKNKVIIMPSSTTSNVRTILAKNNPKNVVLRTVSPLMDRTGNCVNHVISNTRNVNQIQYYTNIFNNALNTIAIPNMPKISGKNKSGVENNSDGPISQRQNIVLDNTTTTSYRNEKLDNEKNMNLESNEVARNVESETPITVSTTEITTYTTPFTFVEDNEDVPLDIMNMPIVLDTGRGEESKTMTFLDSDGSTFALEQPNQIKHLAEPDTSSAIVMNSTDWELELDNVIAVIPSQHLVLNNNKSTGMDVTENVLQNKTFPNANSCYTGDGSIINSTLPKSISSKLTTNVATSFATPAFAKNAPKCLSSNSSANVKTSILVENVGGNRKLTILKKPFSICSDNEIMKSTHSLSLLPFKKTTDTIISGKGTINSYSGDVNLIMDGDNFENVIAEDYINECIVDKLSDLPPLNTQNICSTIPEMNHEQKISDAQSYLTQPKNADL